GGTPAARGEVHISNPPPPPGAAATSGPGVTGVGSGDPGVGSGDPGVGSAAVGNTGAGTSGPAPLLLVGVGILAWAVFAGVGLVGGLGLPFRASGGRAPRPSVRSRQGPW
ncbi:MAG: hypothetical protein J2P29_12015, partial [Actinobacteria bacterium]|nr:hypothetical protein [Actinomycetota bacterium]